MRAKKGPPPFELVLEDHGPSIHRFLLARVGPDGADDCFQETMIAALRAWDDLRDGTAVRSWLFAIAANKAIDSHRSSSRTPEPDGEIEIAAVSPGADPVYERVAADGDPVWASVRALPEKQAAAVTLRYRGDLSHRDVGAILGISEEAARRNVFEGLKRLRAEYAERVRNERQE
ncbi:MAG: RNA polymerase sigma factor [Actinomycetota bacterium]|nr:RNA polymerase sigma factor [Actinomycetota bacterium]